MTSATENKTHEQLLAEIFMRPATEIKTERFTENSATCSGICKSGTCSGG